MTDDDREILARARRLLLAVATDLDDARQKLLRDVGLEVDDWYGIAVFVAEEMVRQLDAEYVATELLAGKPFPSTCRPGRASTPSDASSRCSPRSSTRD